MTRRFRLKPLAGLQIESGFVRAQEREHAVRSGQALRHAPEPDRDMEGATCPYRANSFSHRPWVEIPEYGGG